MSKSKLKILTIFLAATALILPYSSATENVIIPSNTVQSAGPDLQYYPTSHDFGYVEQGNFYYTNFEIWNAGNGTLTWNPSTSQSWITFRPSSGSSTGERDTVNVRVDTTGLSPGVHTGFIILNSNDTSSISSFTIMLIVNQPPYTPSRPNGPSTGVIGNSYSYSTTTTDPEGDSIRYGLDYNMDDIVDNWSTNYYPSGAMYNVNIRFLSAGTYYLRFKAKDVHGAQSDFSSLKIVTITGGNNAPSVPITPLGPSSGSIDTSYSFDTQSTDSEADDVRYGWDWDGDNVVDQWTGFYPSGDLVTLSHLYSTPGSYQIKVVAEDEHGAQSLFSSPKIITITGNVAPNQPEMPMGPINGKSGISYTYTSSTIDANGDLIYYQFDWGDNTNSGWIGPYESGSEISASHIWDAKGSFPVKIKAIDDPNGDGNLDDGKESVWSEPLEIKMPKGNVADKPLFTFLEYQSRLFLLFQQLLQIQ